MSGYIGRMEQEFKENLERYSKGSTYLESLNHPKEDAIAAVSNVETGLLKEQLYSMES